MENEPLPPLESTTVQQDDAANLRHYWHVILERRWLVITAFVSIFVLTLIYLFRESRDGHAIFQATARIQINREEDNLLSKDTISFMGFQEEQPYLQTQYKNLKSWTLIESVARQLKLGEDRRYMKHADVLRAVWNDITITPIRLSRLVDVSVQHTDPKRAALIVNRLIGTFIDKHLDYMMQAGIDVVHKLETEAQSSKNKLEDAENALNRYVMQEKQVSFEETENIVLQALKQLQTEYEKAKAESVVAQEAVAAVDKELARPGGSITSIPQIANNISVQSLQKDLAVLEADFAELQKRYKSKHPFYARAVDKIESLRTSITNQANTIIAALRTSAETAGKTQARLAELVQQQTEEQLKVKEKRIKYSVLKREANAADTLYNAVLKSMKETDLKSRNKVNNIIIIDPATVPLKPVKPRIALTLVLGFLGGLGIAIGLAFFVNYLDDSIKSQDDVEVYLRLPFLGYVPNIKTNSVVERDLQAHLHPQSNAAEGFRTLRASISLTPRSDRFRVLAVTSTIPSEGKSLVASNLGIVIAQTGLKTLLIDADLRRPSVHKAFQLHSPTGLSSFLMGDTDEIDPIVHKTEVPNLDVVCCGAVPTNPSELIGSKRMVEFLEAVRTRYDRILLDSPPISAVSDPLIIAAVSDGVVYVTKFNKIRREHARKSIQRLQDAGIGVVGIVLNDIDFEGKDSYYYSYYYYQNRYYSSHYRSDKSKAAKDKEKEKDKDPTPDLAKDRN